MKKQFYIVILFILIGSLLTSCNITNKKSDREKQLDLNKIAIAYSVTNFAWGEINYAYIVNGYGDVKKVDLVSKKLEGAELISYLEDSMKNSEMPVYTNVSEIPKDIINKIETTTKVKLEHKNEVGNVDMGIVNYYCTDVNMEDGLFVIQTLGDSIYKSKDKNILKICEYIDDVIKKIKQV